MYICMYTYTSVATRETKYWSCETSTTAPSKFWTESASAAIDLGKGRDTR